MRLILAQYINTLRERDEYDRLLPDLLVTMGYKIFSKPQVGVRQDGVDFAAVGKSSHDDIEEVLLFVIKQGDLDRKNWNTGENAIRPSIDEVFDVYLQTRLEKKYKTYRKKIIVAITGEMSQALEQNWAGYVQQHESDEITLELWSGGHVAGLIEEHMLNEHIFDANDRVDLRKCLALAGDNDYQFKEFKSLLMRQLGLDQAGKQTNSFVKFKELEKALKRVNLATQICVQWVQTENTKQALWMLERALLWSWHRIQLCSVSDSEQEKLMGVFWDIFLPHTRIMEKYIEKLYPYTLVKDGMVAGYSSNSSILSVVLFEHIGQISLAGLFYYVMPKTNEQIEAANKSNLALGKILLSIIKNNSASASSRLDRHIVDISLAIVFLIAIGFVEEVKTWLKDIAYRLTSCYVRKRYFPISSDSLDDLAEISTSEDESFISQMMSTSWTLATIAAFCAFLKIDEVYKYLAKAQKEFFPQVHAQIWCPTQDWPDGWYFDSILYQHGETDVWSILPDEPHELLERIGKLCSQEKYQWDEMSIAKKQGLWALDFMGCRHFQMPVPMVFLSKLFNKEA